MVVIDTNVLACLFVDGPFSELARNLYEADADWRSEPFVLIEFTNVLARQVRTRRLGTAAASPLLERARAVMADSLHEADHGAALAIASRHDVSAYDARFLGVALALGSKLVTEDAALRRKAPGLTRSLAQALAN